MQIQFPLPSDPAFLSLESSILWTES